MKHLRHPAVITDLEQSKMKRKRLDAIQAADTEEEREEALEEHTIPRISREDYSVHTMAGCRLCTSHERRSLRPHKIEEEP